jgi:thiol-disulfide isomerase/thioredoxin
MKKIALLSLCLLAAARLVPQTPGDRSPGLDVTAAFAQAGIPLLRRPVPPVDFLALLPDGKTIRLSELKGKVVLLNFWATWCGPCRAEMPSMETLYQRFKGRGLEILAVDCGETEREVNAFMGQFRLTFPAALDSSGKISGQYGITAIPSTFIINREGLIIARVVGSLNWNTPELRSAFDALLSSPRQSD